jgi:hypothetical protein
MTYLGFSFLLRSHATTPDFKRHAFSVLFSLSKSHTMTQSTRRPPKTSRVWHARGRDLFQNELPPSRFDRNFKIRPGIEVHEERMSRLVERQTRRLVICSTNGTHFALNEGVKSKTTISVSQDLSRKVVKSANKKLNLYPAHSHPHRF